MTARDDLLPLFTQVNQILSDFGLRTIRVAIRDEVWTAPIGTFGATAVTTDTEITPTPSVDKISDEDAAVIAATLPAEVNGRGVRPQFRVSGIPKSTTLTSLIQPSTTTPSRRVLVMLSGTEHGLSAYPGDAFEVVVIEGTDQFCHSLIVGKAQDL